MENVSQKCLAELLGVSRQAIYDWQKVGLPRNKDRSYGLAAVLRWLRLFYKTKSQGSYYERNKKRILTQARANRVKNREEYRAKEKAYYAENREKILAKAKASSARKRF